MKQQWMLYVLDGCLTYFLIISVLLYCYNSGNWIHYFICFIILAGIRCFSIYRNGSLSGKLTRQFLFIKHGLKQKNMPMEITQNTAIIKLGKVYDVVQMSAMIDFYQAPAFQHLKYVIIDASELTYIDSAGAEILLIGDYDLQKRPTVLFCSFPDPLKPTLKILNDGLVEIIHFPDVKAAKEFIDSREQL